MLWRSRDVEAPAERVWDVLVDLDQWPRWGPTVSGARLDQPGRRLGPDSTGAVRTPLGLWLPFAIDRWVEGREWSWRVAGLPATHHQVLVQGPMSSRVEMGVPVWAAPYLAVVAVGVRRVAALAED